MEEIKKFNNWFKNNLKISRFPLHNEISNYDIIINVSDEYIDSICDVCLKQNIKYYWFPMNETTDNIGINSIYGALQILWIAEKRNKKVLLHCHAGSNRSVTVQECYYFLITGQHLIRLRNEKQDSQIEAIFTFTSEEEKKDYRRLIKQNRLFNNIEIGHLPSKFKIETFLKQCYHIFEKYSIADGGYLDTIKIKSKIQ